MLSLTTINEFIEEQSEYLSKIDDLNFNTLQFCRDIERSKATSAMTLHILQKLNAKLLLQLDTRKLTHFVGKIFKGYMQEVQYHNDMHALDVLQMCYIFMTKGKLIEFAQLSEMDTLSICISAICHDYGHDGFTNAYHINDIS